MHGTLQSIRPAAGYFHLYTIAWQSLNPIPLQIPNQAIRWQLVLQLTASAPCLIRMREPSSLLAVSSIGKSCWHFTAVKVLCSNGSTRWKLYRIIYKRIPNVRLSQFNKGQFKRHCWVPTIRSEDIKNKKKVKHWLQLFISNFIS